MFAALTPWFVLAAVVVGFAIPRRRGVAALVAVLALAQAVVLEGEALEILSATAAMALSTIVVVRLRERVEAGQDALRELALRDALTGVGNYRLLYSRLTYEIARHRRSGEQFAVLLLDLDGFKEVNDRSGHLAGDRLLREVAGALEGAVRAQDTVARQGGDEFAVLAPGTGEAAATVLAGRIEEGLEAVGAEASVGWALYPEDGRDLEELLERADARQRRVKARRRSVAAGRRAA